MLALAAVARDASVTAAVWFTNTDYASALAKIGDLLGPVNVTLLLVDSLGWTNKTAMNITNYEPLPNVQTNHKDDGIGESVREWPFVEGLTYLEELTPENIALLVFPPMRITNETEVMTWEE
jgi:hypothetical protein